jgi:uncharacterized protein (DUF3084 family)
MFVLFAASDKKGDETMSPTQHAQRCTEELDQPEQQVRDIKRQLVKANQQIRKLQANMVDQKQRNRALQTQVKHEDSLAAEREELKAEVADLKGEVRELTRANREQVEIIDGLRTEIGTLKASANVRKLNETAAAAHVRETLQPGLS